VKMALYR